MDLRIYYQQLRQLEATVPSDPALVCSLATPDGGKAGVISEVSRGVAAQLLLQGRARLASAEEGAAHRASAQEKLERYERESAVKRIQVTVVPETDSRKNVETRKG
jgi:hypothetical protein